MDAPIITIFVRHDADCKHADEPFYKQCGCWKHLRWSYNGKQYRRATKCKTWAEAERVKREIELSYETAGKPLKPDGPAMVRQAVETFIHDKQGQNLSAGVIGKFRRELGRLVEFCEHKGNFYLPEVTLPDLTEFRSSWHTDYPSSITRQRVQARLRAFFRYAQSAGYIQRNPAADMSAIKVKQVPDATPHPGAIQEASRHHSRRVPRRNKGRKSTCPDSVHEVHRACDSGCRLP